MPRYQVNQDQSTKKQKLINLSTAIQYASGRCSRLELSLSLTEMQVASLVEDHGGSGGGQHLGQAGQVKHGLWAGSESNHSTTPSTCVLL